MRLIFPAVFAVALSALPCAQAASNNAATTSPAVSAATNAKPADVKAALFDDPAIARGKGFEIKRSELDEVIMGFKSAAAAGGQVIPEARLVQIEGQLLNRLIQIQLLLQKATAADKAEGAKNAGSQISALLARAGSQEALDRQIKALGMTPDELRSKITQEATAQLILMKELKVNVTDLEATNFYAGHPEAFERPEMVHVAHILLLTHGTNAYQEMKQEGTEFKYGVKYDDLSEDQKAAKKKQMEAILKKARAGEDFARLAREYSEDPISKDKGGEVTFARMQTDLPEFEAAAFSLNTNQISDVVTTKAGYQIIKLLEKIPSGRESFAGPDTKTVMLKDDGHNATIREILSAELLQKQAVVYLAKLQKDAGVEIVDEKLKLAEPPTGAAGDNSSPGKTGNK